jgi:acetyl-CoA carboxylase biotin carboxyl carrier protein
MPEDPTESAEKPDLNTILYLVRLMHRYDLTAIDLGEGKTKIRLRRRGADSAASAPAHPTVHLPAPVPQPPPKTTALAEPAAPSKTAVIESPMVGTFYSSSAPDAPPFVTVGSVVNKDTTVCIIEAMKVFTDIPASVSGTITEILVKNGQPVEFAQPLFRVSLE